MKELIEKYLTEARFKIPKTIEVKETFMDMDNRITKGEYLYQGKAMGKLKYQLGYSQVQMFSQQEIERYVQQGKMVILR